MHKTDFEKQRILFQEKFIKCQPALSAIGDETRQLIIKTLIKHCGEGGIRVGEIQKSTNISRTTVSHHLKILMNAGIINVHQCGTMNFYFLDPKSSSLKLVTEFWKEAEQIAQLCPITKKEAT